MNISIDNDSYAEINQGDIDDIWSYLMGDQKYFIHTITSYLRFKSEYYEDELRPLYEKLKKHYEKV